MEIKGIRLRARDGYKIIVGDQQIIVSRKIYYLLKELLTEKIDKLNFECLSKVLTSDPMPGRAQMIKRCFGEDARTQDIQD